MHLLYNITSCVDVKFKAMPDENELELEAAMLQKSRRFLGGEFSLLWTELNVKVFYLMLYMQVCYMGFLIVNMFLHLKIHFKSSTKLDD